ncbi:Disease resistance protein RPS4B [Cardamine amara subsp. amara]|uniref:Disease resistance protein RPS4B n=1 Tax=Cardamine amara subsp. amara TaxID=228776 RepID=A0ABD0ZNM6_CARAN
MVGSSSSSSTVEEPPPQNQVFINFRGEELRNGFISHLVTALESNNINVFIDMYEKKGQKLKVLLERIVQSRIALVILSMKYTESDWCLRELAMIKNRVDEGKLVAIPIFYKLDPSTVEGLRGDFGDAFRDLVESDKLKKKEWKEALKWIPSLIGITVEERR